MKKKHHHRYIMAMSQQSNSQSFHSNYQPPHTFMKAKEIMFGEGAQSHEPITWAQTPISSVVQLMHARLMHMGVLGHIT